VVLVVNQEINLFWSQISSFHRYQS